jgi:isoleucyl-tRNA synthetase
VCVFFPFLSFSFLSLVLTRSPRFTAYRLYTVVAQMLNLIDELTNWYIRFNRRRLKGENGLEDTIHALNTLFETLFTLVRTLSAFTPFLTENIYQGLRPFFPDDTSNLNVGKDVRSLHFLPFPSVREEYFDPVIERQVSRLQAVVDLGRNIREKAVIPIKTPLAELVVFHPDAEYLEDVKSLLPYIEQELNVRSVVFSSDEAQCGIKFRAGADYTVLGRKLRKDIGRVKKALPSVPSEDVKAYLATGKITVDGIELVAGDLTATRYVELPPRAEDGDGPHYETNTNNDVVILLDVRRRPELEQEGTAREVINRVQRLRKKAGLVATDDIDVYYSFTEGVGAELAAIIEQSGEVLRRTLKRTPLPKSELKAEGREVVIEEEQEVGEEKVTLTLVRA